MVASSALMSSLLNPPREFPPYKAISCQKKYRRK